MFSFLKPQRQSGDIECIRTCGEVMTLAEAMFGKSTGSPARDLDAIAEYVMKLERAHLDVARQETPGANATVKRMVNISLAALEK